MEACPSVMDKATDCKENVCSIRLLHDCSVRLIIDDRIYYKVSPRMLSWAITASPSSMEAATICFSKIEKLRLLYYTSETQRLMHEE
ncbi:hypothetical protein Dimus_024243, partial [Dionaea muscipula]